MKIAYIIWVDSHSPADSGWLKRAKIDTGPLLCYSIGIVVDESKHNITVAGHWDEENLSYTGIMTIPKVAIKRIKKIKI